MDTEQNIPRADGKTWRRLRESADLVAKIAIPLAVAFFAWVQHDVAQKSEESLRERESDLKLVEIAWSSLMDTSQVQKTTALNLLRTAGSDLALKVAVAFSEDPHQPAAVRGQALRVTQELSVSALSKYKVDIYYLETSDKSKSVATHVQSIMATRLPTVNTVLAPRSSANLRKMVPPSGNEVRYEPPAEKNAALALATILNGHDSSLALHLQSVVATKTPGILSIFVASPGVRPPPDADSSAYAD